MKYIFILLFNLIIITLPAQYSLQFSVDTDPGQCTGRIGVKLGSETGPYRIDLLLQGNGGNPLVQTKNGSGTIIVFEDVCEGFYVIKITDSFGCENTDLKTTIKGCESLTLSNPQSFVKNSSNCNTPNGAIDTWPPPFFNSSNFIWQWSTGSSDARGISDLAPGVYTLTITEETGCTSTFSFTVEGEMISLFGFAEDACQGMNNGQIEVDALNSGNGQSTYDFQWNNGATSTILSGLSPGTYCVTATQTNTGCIDSDCFEVGSIPGGGTLSLSGVTTKTCIGVSTGSIVTTVFGGTPPYSYQWSAYGAGGYETDLAAGHYGITVTDYCGSAASRAFSIEEYDESSLVIKKLNGLCSGEKGEIFIEASDDSEMTYDWYLNDILLRSGRKNFYKNNMEIGVYDLIAIDENGCSTSFTFEIRLVIPGSENLKIVLNSFEDINCYEGFIRAGITGGTPPYIAHWEENYKEIGRGPNIDGLSPGFYTLHVRDYCGATTIKRFNLTCYCKPLFRMSSTSNPCSIPFKIRLDAIGGEFFNSLVFGITYVIKWHDGDESTVRRIDNSEMDWSNRRRTFWSDQSISVSVLDHNGCEQIIEATLSTNNSNVVSIVDVNNVWDAQEQLDEIRPEIFNNESQTGDWTVQTSCMSIKKCGDFIDEYDLVSNLKFRPNDSNSTDPCESGGSIECQLLDGTFLNVPPNYFSKFWEFPDGRCGCLFPPFIFPNHDLLRPIYVEMPCDEFQDNGNGGGDDPDDPSTAAYDEDFCECDTWCYYENIENGADCGYKVFCAGSNVPIKTVYLSESEWYDCTKRIIERDIDDPTAVYEFIQVWRNCPTDPCYPGSYFTGVEFLIDDIDDDHEVYDLPHCQNCPGIALTQLPDSNINVTNDALVGGLNTNTDSISTSSQSILNYGFTIYPNPVSSKDITIQFANEELEEIMITTIEGRVITGFRIVKNGIENKVDLIFNKNLSSGIYLLKVKMKTGKIIVEKLVVI